MSIAKITVVVKEQTQLTSDVYSLVLEAGELVTSAVPGQFISVFCNNGSRLLPRPISICEVDKEAQTFRIVYRTIGAGTHELKTLVKGDTLDIMGPLGNGFPLLSKKAFLIGGGIGIPPMLELAKQLNCEKQIILGYRDEIFLDEELAMHGSVTIASEDGKHGIKGNVMDAIKAHNLSADVIYACGPTPMLRAIKEYAIANGIECYLSLEERMACGIGACLGCVCKSKEIDHHTNVKNKRICKDGPVFLAQEVELS